jgi:hypothetical protein
MAFRGGFITAACAFLVWATPASAEPITVLGEDGRTSVRQESIPRGYGPRPTGAEPAGKPRAASSAKRRTIRGELGRMLEAGAIDQAEHDARRSLVRRAEDLLDKLSGARAAQLGGALGAIETIAAQGSLTVSRLEPLWRILETNIEWANTGPLLYSGQRVSLEGSELIYQYVPGSGLQIHPLANAGKLNDLWKKNRTVARDGRIQQMLEELLPLGVQRAGGTAWEYYFPYSGRAPWVSGMAQATILQAMSRASIRLGIREQTWPLLKSGLNVFETPPPSGVRVTTSRGAHYVLYSQRPNLRVLNGFAQSLVGLFDFAAYANDDRARALFSAGDAELQSALPDYDTGAWSLYSRLEVTREADLSYHRLVTGFLENLCKRTLAPAYCESEQRFATYMTEPPTLEVTTRRLRGATTGQIRFGLSKISRVSVRVTRKRKTVLSRSGVLMGYGRRSFSWYPPNKPGSYSVSLSATDLAGNSMSVAADVEVLKKKKRRRR